MHASYYVTNKSISNNCWHQKRRNSSVHCDHLANTVYYNFEQVPQCVTWAHRLLIPYKLKVSNSVCRIRSGPKFNSVRLSYQKIVKASFLPLQCRGPCRIRTRGHTIKFTLGNYYSDRPRLRKGSGAVNVPVILSGRCTASTGAFKLCIHNNQPLKSSIGQRK